MYSKIVKRYKRLNMSNLTLLQVPDFGVLYYGFRGSVVITGTNDDDIITSRDFDSEDTVIAFAKSGDDKLVGRNGDDYLDAGSGDDIIYAEEGNDFLRLGWGDDTAYGGIGDDTLNGGLGNDSLLGGYGNDKISGGNGNDSLFGVAGNNVLRGGNGNDSITGGAGRDWMVGGNGLDTLTGGNGVDHYILNSDSNGDIFNLIDADNARDIIVLNAEENSSSQNATVFDFSPEDDVLIRIYPGVADIYNGWDVISDGLGNQILRVSHGTALSVIVIADVDSVNVREIFL